MFERETHRGSTLVRPRATGDREVPASPRPEPTPRPTGFWPLVALVIAGTVALAAWALWPSSSSELDSAGSGYAGDWKDTVVAERADGAGDTGGASSGHAWDLKDRIVAERAEAASQAGGASSGYTGDWKDTVATERAAGGTATGDWKDTVTAERAGTGPR